MHLIDPNDVLMYYFYCVYSVKRTEHLAAHSLLVYQLGYLMSIGALKNTLSTSRVIVWLLKHVHLSPIIYGRRTHNSQFLEKKNYTLRFRTVIKISRFRVRTQLARYCVRNSTSGGSVKWKPEK